MKTWKLVSGIISIVLSVFVVFQSMMAGYHLDHNRMISFTSFFSFY